MMASSPGGNACDSNQAPVRTAVPQSNWRQRRSTHCELWLYRDESYNKQ
jgi:hypothetical protein